MEHAIYQRALAESFDAKIGQLIYELESYSGEKVIWQTNGHVTNSAGTLAIHLLGNLNHFIGALLGNTGYVRNRPLEFTLSYKPRMEILEELNACRLMVSDTLKTFDAGAVAPDFPVEISGSKDPDQQSLIHIFGHLSYHVGQINYHRRLLDN